MISAGHYTCEMYIRAEFIKRISLSPRAVLCHLGGSGTDLQHRFMYFEKLPTVSRNATLTTDSLNVLDKC